MFGWFRKAKTAPASATAVTSPRRELPVVAMNWREDATLPIPCW